MSFANLFQPIIARMRRTQFGRKIEVDGVKYDTGVQLAISELMLAFDENQIEPEGPVEINASGLSVPVFRIIAQPGVAAIEMVGTDGSSTMIGGSESVAAAAQAAKSFVGTTNQVNVSDDGTTVTFSTPQDIDTGATPTFDGLYLTTNPVAAHTLDLLFRQQVDGALISYPLATAGAGGQTGLTLSGAIGLNLLATAPTTDANAGFIFAADVAGTTEVRVKDGAGNVTTISPHGFALQKPCEPLAWSYHSERVIDGRRHTIEVDWLRVLRTLERLSGEKLVYVDVEEPPAPPAPRVRSGRYGIAIGTYQSVEGYGVEAVRLNLAVCRACNPDAAILVCDDASSPEAQAEYREVCKQYDAEFVSNETRRGHTSGDMDVFRKAIIWGSSRGLDTVCKLSQRMVIDIPGWLDRLSRDLILTEHGTATSGLVHDGNIGVRTEFVLMDLWKWDRADVLDHIAATRNIAGWWNEGHILDAIHKFISPDAGYTYRFHSPPFLFERGIDKPPVYFRTMAGDPLAHFRALGLKYGIELSENFSTRDSVESADYKA